MKSEIDSMLEDVNKEVDNLLKADKEEMKKVEDNIKSELNEALKETEVKNEQ